MGTLETLQMIREVVTIFGVIAGLTYYIITVRNQTKARHMQIIRGVVSNIRSSPNFNYESLDVIWEDYDDFWEKYGPKTNPKTWNNIELWFDSFEEYGVYVREGMLDVRLICLTSGGSYMKSWEKFGPVWQEHRKRINEPRYWIEAEYIYHRIKDYMDKHPELMQ
jgi:hypothetical protein